ncbi:MAG TPA: hypothetical protein VG796_20775 [Verrucomicrobiales bacterium]|nr:hypothetical protein [Verrucomicrobiales bacterium]
MKSWLSKASAGVALVTACGTLNSCSLFGGEKYFAQTEVETEVPESLDRGKPSSGPVPTKSSDYAGPAGVPPTSNLIETPEPDALSGASAPPLPPPPSADPAGNGTVPGGASVVGATPENGKQLIDIPKPDFNEISVHNTRPPAEMLSLGPPTKPANLNTKPAPPSARIQPEKAAAAPEIIKKPEVAGAKVPTGESEEPGVPLLHSNGSLSEFYQTIHKEILDGAAAGSQPASGVTSLPPPEETNGVPQPPPPADYAAPPPPPPAN